MINGSNANANKGRKLSEEHKQLLRERFSGENNPNYGKHTSEETKAILREKLSGKNSPNYGKEFSEETKQKMRDNMAMINPIDFVILLVCKYLFSSSFSL